VRGALGVKREERADMLSPCAMYALRLAKQSGSQAFPLRICWLPLITNSGFAQSWLRVRQMSEDGVS
jgi:hypothetical protein